MSKKSKKKPAVEDHLETPAAISPEVSAAIVADLMPSYPPPPDSSWRWPDSTETRPLVVKHDDHARSEIGLEMGRIKLQMVSLEDEKKGIAQQFKTKIDDLDARLEKFAHVLKNGGEEQSVRCRWIFEVSGRDADGGWVRHPEYKSLAREDTGEVVHTVKITEQDRQANLDLDEDEASLNAALDAMGFKLEEREFPGENETAFILTGDIVPFRAIEGDSRLAALRNAVTMLRSESLAAASDATKADAYTAGAQARRDNLDRSRVPHEPGTMERNDWLTGWDDEELEVNTADDGKEAA